MRLYTYDREKLAQKLEIDKDMSACSNASLKGMHSTNIIWARSPFFIV
jgi:hypothetical protein